MNAPLHISEHHKYDEQQNVVIYHKCTPPQIKDYNGIDVKIDIYEARVKDWFFGVVSPLVEHGMNSGDYVSVMVALSYIEGVQQFREGKETPRGKSGEWFNLSAKRVFPGQSDNAINRLWKETRCGLFHTGFPNGKIYLSHDRADAIKEEGDGIYINPKQFLIGVVKDFDSYISDLRNPANLELRNKFETLWDVLWKAS